MSERWRFNPREKEQLRTIIGRLLLGSEYKPEEPLIKQLAELRSQNGPILGQRLGLLGFLAGSNPAPQEKETPEWEKMPLDYAGGPTEWVKLSEAEKQAIYEALKMGRKTYISKYTEESKRAMLDSDILMSQKLKNMFRQF